MAAGLSREQFNAMARRRLQDIAKTNGGLYRPSAGEVRFGDVAVTFRRINASNGECAGLPVATNTVTGKVVDYADCVGDSVMEMVEKARVAV